MTFHATLAPMQITRFDCKLKELPTKPTYPVKEDSEYYYFENDRLQININKQTGLIDRLTVDGKLYFSENAMSIDVYRDNEDPWGMKTRGWKEQIGTFTLLDEAEGSAFSALNKTAPSVRLIENGEVRTVIEAVFGYGSSKAYIRYGMPKHSADLNLDIHIVNADQKKLYKLSVPYELQNASAFAETAFGEEKFRLNGDENVHQKYVRLESEDGKAFRVYNKGIYSSSLGENKLLISLMRSPSYCAHPIGDIEILPQDRTCPYIEQGERDFSLRFSFGKTETSCGLEAQIYNEKATCLSFFPSGTGTKENTAFFRLEGGTVILSALKKAEKENDYVLRLFNPTNEKASCRFVSEALALEETIEFSPFEIKTFRLAKGLLCEWSLEFITAYLNNANNEDDIKQGTELAKQLNIPIHSIKFRHSTAKYSCDESGIYKGVSSIKFLNDDAANDLYSIKDEQFNSFIDLLVRITELRVDSRKLDILIKLDFFSEFGSPNYLLKCNELFNKYHGKKQMKKDKAFEEGLDFDIIRKYSTKETPKTFTGLDSMGMINELVQSISDNGTDVRTRIAYQLDNLGYIDIANKKYAGCCIVQDLNVDYSPKLNLYALANGNTIPVKIDKKTFKINPLKRGDIVKVTRQNKRPKMKKIDGQWMESDEKEWWITEYEVIRGDLV